MSTQIPPPKSGRRVQVLLSTTALLSFMSISKATALAFAELGVACFFVSGVARSAVGDYAPWFVLAAVLLSILVRTIDIEGWGLFIPGGVVGRAERAFGSRVSTIAASSVLIERLLFVALACALCGHYALSFGASWFAEWSVTARLTVQEIVVVGSTFFIGILWARYRLGVSLLGATVSRAIWFGAAILGAVLVFSVRSATRLSGSEITAALGLTPSSTAGFSFLSAVLYIFFGLAVVLPVLGGGDALGRAAREFAPPRLQALRRTSRFVSLFGVFITGLSAFLFVLLVPSDTTSVWIDIPLSALAQYVSGPKWILGILTLLVPFAAFLILLPAAQGALEDAEQLLRRLSVQRHPVGQVSPSFSARGTTYPLNVAAVAAIAMIFASGAQITWLSHAYGIAIAATVLLKVAALLRLRETHEGQRPYSAPINLHFKAGEFPLGLWLVGAAVLLPTLAILVRGDVPSFAALSSIVGVAGVIAVRQKSGFRVVEEQEPFEVSTSPDVSLGQVQVRPDNVLICVRHPQSLHHVADALRQAGERDIVIVTIRMLGIDVDEESGENIASTREERRLFTAVAAITERHSRPVRMLIVPAHNVFDGIIAVSVRLQSSEVHVGESSTLSGDDQGRLLGEAWERAEKPASQHLRLVIHRPSGRTDSYYVGAHLPSLSANDLDLIHRVWLDAVKAVGRHVHHHDVVRAALAQMEHQLTGPQREEALNLIREVARPADELATAIRAGDFHRLRDMVRNRHASEVASALTQLAVEDQVVVFRILPRKNAATVFEYLSLEQQEALLKAMAQEDVASLLNNMSPDDRTTFLEELPASVTRQLLALLTPAERSVALTLLGYPEASIGRLMTPHYVSVREHWTVREVLDFIRMHGQDSETLNVVYVVDEQGLLIDDIRIREFLLTPLENHVSDLMDRRFVALKATDDQKTAVGMFRQYDRTALPVTDTAGMLIGIVTIDDVLDVAEEAATREIQRIGGSEALDEPYMRIDFFKMVKKRAGWLTALFLGEMLTATAMTAFEGEIARATVLALFIPLIISSGGNSGSQAATLVIRALALGEVGLADWWRVIRREVFAGLALGSILAVIGFLRISIWSAFSDVYGEHWLLVALTVALTLIGVVLWGTIVGSLLPMVLRRLGFDPATSSAPFVATLVDVTGLVIYFSMALLVLHGTLLKGVTP